MFMIIVVIRNRKTIIMITKMTIMIIRQLRRIISVSGLLFIMLVIITICWNITKLSNILTTTTISLTISIAVFKISLISAYAMDQSYSDNSEKIYILLSI